MNIENTQDLPLVDKDYLLQKMPGKGGWTYVMLPEISSDKHTHFGLVKVKGTIDSYEIDNYNLMPMGNGNLILSVKAEIRKIIAKQEGDWVHVKLYSQSLPQVSKKDFHICLNDDPTALINYNQLTENEQKTIIDWIFSVKNDDLRVERIALSLEKLSNSHK